MYAGAVGATVLFTGVSAFAQGGDYQINRNNFNNNYQQPNQNRQNILPQLNINFGRNGNGGNGNNNYNNNNNRDNNYIENCNRETYTDREDSNGNLDINRDGSVVIRNAVVNSVSGSNMTVTTQVGPATLTWTIVLDRNTRFESRNGRQIDLREVAVGDKVTVKGKMLSGSALSVDGDLVRDTLRTQSNNNNHNNNGGNNNNWFGNWGNNNNR